METTALATKLTASDDPTTKDLLVIFCPTENMILDT